MINGHVMLLCIYKEVSFCLNPHLLSTPNASSLHSQYIPLPSMLFAAYCGVTNAVRYQVSIDNAHNMMSLTHCVTRPNSHMLSPAQTSLPSLLTGFPLPSLSIGGATLAVSWYPSTMLHTLLMLTPLPMMSFISLDHPFDLGLLLLSLSLPTQPPTCLVPVFMSISHLGPFMSSPVAPIVGIGAKLMQRPYLTPLNVTFQQANPLTNGCVSHPLYLHAQGVMGTNILLPTRLCLVLPLVSHKVIFVYICLLNCSRPFNFQPHLWEQVWHL